MMTKNFALATKNWKHGNGPRKLASNGIYKNKICIADSNSVALLVK